MAYQPVPLTQQTGAAGEVLATNATGDGFEWVTP